MGKEIEQFTKDYPRHFGFLLEWGELPEDFRERKIANYVAYADTNGLNDEINSNKDVVESERMFIKRRDAEKEIARHFPIWF